VPGRRLVRGGSITLAVALLCAGGWATAQQSSDEEVARRQLDSGRSFARQGNYAEALKDFRAVAETHSGTSVADNALLEIARYFFDVVGDHKEAGTAVDVILKKYATSDSAPDAYLIAGQLAMARSHQAADLETAIANFDRVARLFPTAEAVPRSLQFAGQAFWYQGRLDDAMASLVRVGVEYASHPAASHAFLQAGLVLTSKGDAIGAMEELQQVRNRWPGSREAETALGRLTMLHRLYVRAKGGGAAFAATAETAGPARLQDVLALGQHVDGSLYWVGENGLGALAPAKAPAPPAAQRPRGFARDSAGALWAIEVGAIRPFSGKPLALAVPRPNGVVEPIQKIDAAAQLSNGDWIVADDDEKSIHRFARTGEYSAPFSTSRVRRLAVNAVDEVAAIDREDKGVVILDAAGKVAGRIPARGQGYLFENIEDLAFDVFGHLYVLDRGAIAVFSPHGAAPAAALPAGRRAENQPTGRGAAYRLLTLYTENEKSPGAFRRATAMALDASGGLYLYDERAQRVRVYR
jgi:TolA-binding protein